MRRAPLALSLLALLLTSRPASAQWGVRSLHKINVTYAIHYDDDLLVRTRFAPLSAVRAAGRALTPKELRALRDPGLPGYRATRDDLGLAWYVTIYLEKVVPGPGGKVYRKNYPPITCMVHHNRLSQKYLCLNSPRLSAGNSPPPILIGEGPLGLGIPLPNVRLKLVLVHSYYTRLRP